MVQHALHETQYLNVCKYLQKIYEIKAIKEDEAKWKDVRYYYLKQMKL